MVDKLYTARRVVTGFGGLSGAPTLWVTGRGTAEAEIAKSPTAYACMHIRGTELANLPWHILKNDKILEKHPLIDMITEFGPESNYGEAMLSTEIDRLTFGAGFWFRDHDILKRLNPDTITVKYNRNGIIRFDQEIDGQVVNKFKREEIIYFREYHPDTELDFGLPVMEVVKKSVNAEIEALLMIEAYFKNDAIPGFLLTTEQDVPTTEANRVMEWWNERFRGSRNKHKMGIAGRGLKPTSLGNSMKDTAMFEILDSIQNDICTAMRVPKILVRNMQDATYVNLSESRKFLIEDVIMPRAMEYANVINHDLVQEVDPGVVFEFAFDELQILQEDSNLKSERLLAALTAGIISDEYVREEMGYPESSKGDGVDKTVAAEDKWERKALKALVRGDSADVSFETDNIEIDRQYLLHGRLSNAKTEEAIRACFK